ncbi:MAG: class I SAM-dependent methyltransferase [Candidatus Obscuribacter sp.]|nr:class I SAM-dependent methyltransferase [Candidatus Obscuribacter sp.]
MDEFCRTVRKVDPMEALSFILAERYLRTQSEFYEQTFTKFGIDPLSATILEVGSGYGFFLCYARRILGWNIWGAEPGENEFSGRDEIAAQLLLANAVDCERLVRCTGEALAFDDSSFDVVVSNDVLEHVTSPPKVLEESCRVLKPGGLIMFNIPNYHWIYEGHYNLPWIPSMSKSLARNYVSLFGRDPGFVDTLNFITPASLSEMVRGIDNLQLLQPLEYGCENFLSSRLEAYLSSHAGSASKFSRKLTRSLTTICETQFFKSSTKFLARSTGLYHEMRLVARKVPVENAPEIA